MACINYTKKLSIPVFLLLSLKVAIILHFPLWVSVDSLSLKSPSSCTSSILSKWKSSRSARPIISKPSSISSVANNFYRSNIIPTKSFLPLYTTSDDNTEQTEFDSSSPSSFEASINNITTIDVTATAMQLLTTAATDTTSISNNNKSDDSSTTTTTQDDSEDGLLPSYKRLIVFTATTILIWLSEPLLSLVDTAVVSFTASAKSGVVQIAALGPATTLFDSLIYTTYFLAMVTTNQLAPALASAAKKESKNKNSSNDMNNNNNNNNINPWQDLRQSTSHLLGLALVFGCIVSAITFTAGKSIIAQMVGGSLGAAEANAIIPLATTYATIRAAVAPFSVVGFVAQSVSVSFKF